ncbi:MAG: TIR protein [Stygiobacter sp.]|nr:MAG: TIR protein [Stygiobacter sp.]
MLISKHYLESKWAVLERRAAQDRDLFTEGEYILPIRLDDTEVPGLLRTIGCLEYSSYTDEEIGNLVARKLKRFASS